MPKADVNGIRINYEVTGQGPLAVLNHGLGGNLEMFRPVVERLKGDFTFLTWDNRGCGQSDAGGPYSLRLFSEDLYGLLRALGIDRCVVMGVSWGGVLGQRFALDHPEMVRGLILDSTSSEVNERAAEGWLARGRAMLAGDPSTTLRTGAAPPPPAGAALGGHAVSDAVLAQMKANPEAFMGQCQAVASLKDTPLTPELARIACPALVLAGENDVVAGVGGSVIISRKIAGSRLVIVPDCGHAVVHDAPDVFEREFRAFMAALA